MNLHEIIILGQKGKKKKEAILSLLVRLRWNILYHCNAKFFEFWTHKIVICYVVQKQIIQGKQLVQKNEIYTIRLAFKMINEL